MKIMTKRGTKKKKSGGESPGERERKTDGAEKRQAVRR